MAVVDRIRVIDVDTHISEPENLWTARLPAKWGDMIPRVIKDPRGERHGQHDDVWIWNGKQVMPTALLAYAGHDSPFPSHPPTLADADPASYRAPDRLKLMNEVGLYAQVLYPNVCGFGAGGFFFLEDRELMLQACRAYNDFLVEWCREDTRRLLPILCLPFWDVDESVAEIQRGAQLGFKGVLFGCHPETYGLPWLGDPHWDPVWAAAQEADLSINFHIASGNDDASGNEEKPVVWPGHRNRSRVISSSCLYFLDNGFAISEVIVSGIAHRFPKLNFVSVESGVGWVPFFIEALDWQWKNNGGSQDHPDFDLLPSEYFKRQIYACFWFEEQSALHALEVFPDNIMYETDFPHPTSMSPGPASIAEYPNEYIERRLSGLPEDLLQKILHGTAARVYHLA